MIPLYIYQTENKYCTLRDMSTVDWCFLAVSLPSSLASLDITSSPRYRMLGSCPTTCEAGGEGGGYTALLQRFER